MTGSEASGSRVTALDQARLLLAQAKAQKAASGSMDLASDAGSAAPEQSPRLATVTSFDPDSYAHFDHAHLDHAHLDHAHFDHADLDPAHLDHAAHFDPDAGSADPPDQPGMRLAAVGGGTRLPSVARVQQALDTAGVDRELPTHPAVSELLAGASLRGGSAYSVRGSAALVMALMAGPSAEGAWCGVVGVPSFGAEAARALGVDLERLVLVPDPGSDWLNVVAALVDALTVVVVRPPGDVTPGEASRLAARLRTRGAMLIAYGSWPGSEARFEIESSTWTGLGDGEGLLTARKATVAVTGRRAAVHARRQHLWLPAPDGTIRSAAPAGSSREETPGRPEEWADQIGAVG